MEFALWWASLPKQMKLGDKNRARTRYNAILKRGEGKLLESALAAYKADQARNEWRSWMYCATWLGRWEAYIPEERTELLEDEHPHEPTGQHKHWCELHGHAWVCADELCIFPGFAYCTDARKREPVMQP